MEDDLNVDSTIEDDVIAEIKERLQDITYTIHSVSDPTNHRVISWDRLNKATQEDGVMVKLIVQILRGFPDSQHDLNQELKEYHKYRHSLHVVDGVVCYKGPIVIPTALRSTLLDTIHAAHQGVSGMNSRVEDALLSGPISLQISC